VSPLAFLNTAHRSAAMWLAVIVVTSANPTANFSAHLAEIQSAQRFAVSRFCVVSFVSLNQHRTNAV